MKVPRRLIVNPEENTVLAVACTAISVFILAYSSILGPISILVFFALWLPLPIIGPARAVRIAPAAALMISLPLLACASAVWSDFPYHSLRAALQYLSLAVCAIIAATYVSLRSMVWGLLIGCHIVNVWSLESGYLVYDYFGNSYAFAGLFPSKNTFGFFATLGIFATLAVVLLSPGRIWLRAALLAAGAQFVYALVISDSATSVIAIAGSIAVLLAAVMMAWMRDHFRQALFMVGAFVTVAVLLAAMLVDFQDLLGVVGRDATLTGRTELWIAGLSVFAGAPLLGVGYEAFWVPGVPLAEQLWYDFYIYHRSGFHFHNTFIGVMADLGIVGLCLYLFLLGSALFGAFWQLRRAGGEKWHGVICIALVTLLLIRAVVEIDTFSAYTIGTFLFFYLSVQPWKLAVEARHARALYPRNGILFSAYGDAWPRPSRPAIADLSFDRGLVRR